MEQEYIMDSDGFKRNFVSNNGISFLSERYDQAYFDRKRSNRLNKKLNVDKHLILLYHYSFAVKESDIVDKYGKEALTDEYCLLDKVIDLSYYDDELTSRRKEYFFGCGGYNIDKDGNHVLSGVWLIHAPDKETFENNLSSLQGALQEVIPHDKKEPEYIEDKYLQFYNG